MRWPKIQRWTAAIKIGVSSVLMGFGIFLGLLLIARQDSSVPTEEDRLPQQVYVWQRAWNEAVREGMQRSVSEFSRYLLLAAEVGWKRDRLRLIEVDFARDFLTSFSGSLGLAFRIGPYAGQLDEAWQTRLAEIARSVVTDAKSRGLKVSELQIDFDCPESKLAGYQELIETVQARLPSMRITITVLPAWLDRAAFSDLASLVPGYVLQVHSLHRPRGPDKAFRLCRPKEAKRAVRKAARLGVPFRVALPTYGYRLAFDSEGELVGLTAEGKRIEPPQGGTTRTVRADPALISSLYDAWQTEHPKAMEAIVWYRLPVNTDALNWSWTTLRAVLNDQTLRPEGEVRTGWPEAELVDLVLTNSGNWDLWFEGLSIRVDCNGMNPVAADGLNGFILDDRASNRLIFRPARSRRHRLSPAESLPIGWIRFKEETDVSAYVSHSSVP